MMMESRIKKLLEPNVSQKAKLTAVSITLGRAVETLNQRILETEVVQAKHGTDGKDGRDGKDGIPGTPGRNGVDGAKGKDGKDGKNGKDAPKLVSAEIAADDHLVFHLSDGSIVDAGEMPENERAVIMSSVAGAAVQTKISNTWEGAQIGAITALTSTAASMAIDLAINNNFSHTTSENTTLAAPSNPVAGQSGFITITQGAAARLLAFNTFWDFAGGTIPTLTATIGARDILAYAVLPGAATAHCQLLKDSK